MNYSSGVDSSLFIAKKILVENWRDDLPYPAHKLVYKDMGLKDLLHLVWDLYMDGGFDFGGNTLPENLIIEAPKNAWSDFCFNWKFVDDIIEQGMEDSVYIDVDLSESNGLKKYVKDQSIMFATNKSLDRVQKTTEHNDNEEIELFKIPNFRRNDSNNYYTYQKQKGVMLDWIKRLVDVYKNEYVVLNFNELDDSGVDILRTIICLEYAGLIKIVELDNKKESWSDNSNIYAKIRLVDFEMFGLNSNESGPDKLPPDCSWKGTVFKCGNKKVDFYNTKIFKYFKLLTSNLEKPVLNEVHFKDFGYNKSEELARGVKKDLTRKLKQNKLLNCSENPKGRIYIKPISRSQDTATKKAGYVCTID